MLDDPSFTRAQIAAAINSEAGDTILSTSGINRYALRWAEVNERKKQADQLAEMWEKRHAQTGNRLGRVLNEQMRVMLFDFIGLVDEMRNADGEDAMKDAVDSLLKVSRTLKALEESDRINAAREAEIRDKTLDDAAKAVAGQAKSAGLSEKTAEDFRRVVLGLKDA